MAGQVALVLVVGLIAIIILALWYDAGIGPGR